MAFLNEQEIERIMYKCYKITNLINGKIYIGQTKKTLEQRLRTHWYSANKGSTYTLHKAIRKYGIENFKIELLFEFTTRLECDIKEIELIAENNSINKKIGYNSAKGGSGGDLLSNHPNKIEIIKKQIKSREIFFKNNPSENERRNAQLRKAYDDNKSNICNSIKNRWADENFKKEYIENNLIGDKNPFYGKHHSDETKKILSDKLKISMNTPETKQKLKNRPKKIAEDHHNYVSVDLDKLKELSHLKISELSKIFNVSNQTITRRLQKLGVRK